MARITSTPAQRAGDEAEALVAARLAAAGWTILARNLRLGRDELDLVAVDPGPPPALVVVEVRRRGRRDYGLAEETLDHRKRAALRRAIGALLERRRRCPTAGRSRPSRVRVDLVAVDRDPDGGTAVRHHRGDPAVGEGPRRPCATLPAAAEPPRRATPVPGRSRPGAHTRITSPIGTVPTDRPLRRHQAPAGIRGGTNRRRTFVPTVSMRQLLEAGVHFGHQTRRWNPKMKPYIFAERNGIHIIDLAQTVKRLDSALEFVTETVARGDSVLFVGTKKQAQEPVMQEAMRAGQPYVTKRWLGGMMTNFVTIKKRIGLLDQLEARQLAGDFDRLPKKEAALLTEELNKLQATLGGIRKMKRHPGAIFIVDPHRERIAVTEANKLEIPVVGTGDTNVDPDELDYIIPANDDAIRSIRLLCQLVADAAIEGRACARPAQPRSPRSRRSRRRTSRSSTSRPPPISSPSWPRAGRSRSTPTWTTRTCCPAPRRPTAPPRTRSPPRADAPARRPRRRARSLPVDAVARPTATDIPARGPTARRTRQEQHETWRSLPRPSRTFASAPAPA